ncbi:MAG: carboxylating nicotinate-nucleotide diphosphorylase [Isosphaeraceae bacterium]
MNPIDFDAAARRNAETLIELALAEDLGMPMPHLGLDFKTGQGGIALDFGPEPGPFLGDLTGEATIPKAARGAAKFVSRREGVVAGLPVLDLLARRCALATWFTPTAADGDAVGPGSEIASIAGPMRSMLMVERTALNFLQRLSGVASLTRRFVDAVSGTRAVILDTRKTTPGWRALEKYAVRCGGGRNHRIGLYDAVLIKDNHLAWLEFLGDPDPIGTAIERARALAAPGTTVEVEVDTLDQFDRALECRPDIILVDNLGPEALSEAVRRRDGRQPGVLLESSGGIRLETVRALAETGVDRISVGALTHSAPALDIGLDFDRSS